MGNLCGRARIDRPGRVAVPKLMPRPPETRAHRSRYGRARFVSPVAVNLSRWRDGAVVIGTESYWYLSGLGIAETSLATTEYEPSMSASGDVGMVSVHTEAMAFDVKQILYSPKGEAWIDTKVPPEMGELELTIGFHLPVEVVATDTNVILLLNEANTDEDGTTFIWFLGTPIKN